MSPSIHSLLIRFQPSILNGANESRKIAFSTIAARKITGQGTINIGEGSIFWRDRFEQHFSQLHQSLSHPIQSVPFTDTMNDLLEEDNEVIVKKPLAKFRNLTNLAADHITFAIQQSIRDAKTITKERKDLRVIETKYVEPMSFSIMITVISNDPF